MHSPSDPTPGATASHAGAAGAAHPAFAWPLERSKSPSTLSRALIFAYGAISYVLFLGVFLYAAAFVMGFGVPVTLDTLPGGSFWTALGINLGLLGLFAVQHSVMARPAFKRAWTKIVPEAAERSTYVLFSSIAMIALFAFWSPMGGVLWHAEATWARGLLYAIGALGWLLVLVSTFQLNHFDLFGLRQVYLHLRNRPYTPLKFQVPWLYRFVRHPLYLGWFLAFWGAPTMTVAHLVFALATSAYILIAIRFEERDLIASLGQAYADYRKRVPMLIPSFRPKGAH